MTQAFNLALLANKVNSSGLLDASTALVNAVPVANGGLALSSIAARSIPVANSANTYTTVTPAAGQSVRINAGNTAWEAFTPGTGTVTSIATGNGLTGGTITGSGTLAIAAPASNSVGAYAMGILTNWGSGANFSASAGNTYAAGSGNGPQVQCFGWLNASNCGLNYGWTNTLSGTWRYLGITFSGYQVAGLFVRVA